MLDIDKPTEQTIHTHDPMNYEAICLGGVLCTFIPLTSELMSRPIYMYVCRIMHYFGHLCFALFMAS